jgi:hypothetical protein
VTAAERDARRYLREHLLRTAARYPPEERVAFEQADEVAAYVLSEPEMDEGLWHHVRHLQAAPEHDLALAEWERVGRRGPRPEPSQPELEASIARCQEELLGLHRAVGAVTNERAEFVSKNRKRLVREAHEAAEKAHERAAAALDEAAEAREALVEHGGSRRGRAYIRTRRSGRSRSGASSAAACVVYSSCSGRRTSSPSTGCSTRSVRMSTGWQAR